MSATLSVLLDDGGAHLVTSSVQADDLFGLFSANGILCLRSALDDGTKLHFPKADEILRAHTLLQEWLKRTGQQDTLHATQSANTDTIHA